MASFFSSVQVPPILPPYICPSAHCRCTCFTFCVSCSASPICHASQRLVLIAAERHLALADSTSFSDARVWPAAQTRDLNRAKTTARLHPLPTRLTRHLLFLASLQVFHRCHTRLHCLPRCLSKLRLRVPRQARVGRRSSSVKSTPTLSSRVTS